MDYMPQDNINSDAMEDSSSATSRKRPREGSNSRRSSPRKPQDAKKRKTGRPSKVPPVSADSTLPSDCSTTDVIVATSTQTSEPDLLKLKIGKKPSLIERTDNLDRWGRLPSFILLKIFKTIVDADGPLPTLCRLATVNKYWNAMLSESILWRKVDLSFGWITQEERVLEQIIDSYNLSQLREVNLAGWKNLTNSGVQLLAENCPMLTWVKLSGTRVNSAGVSYLIDKCPDLNSFDLSAMKTDVSHGHALRHLFESRGNKVRSLNMSFNALKNFNSTMKLITTTCCHLRHLDLSNVEFLPDKVSLDIEQMQMYCKRLQVLKIGNTPFQISQSPSLDLDSSLGFVELQVLDVGSGRSNKGTTNEVSNSFLQRILRRSYGLKSLDIRGCTSVTCESLQSLPITDLEKLFISSSSAAKYEGIEIIMTKWRHSLIDLDVSWTYMPSMSMDLALRRLNSDPAKTKLESINLSGTQTTPALLLSMLTWFPSLKKVKLVSCHALPRHLRNGAGENIVQLRQDIASLVAQAEKDEVNTTRDLCLLP